MLSLSRTNGLVSINGDNNNYMTQFIKMSEINVCVSRLLVNAVISTKGYPKESINESKYLVKLRLNFIANKPRIPNRVVKLDLRWSLVYCINTKIYKLNKRMARVIINKKVLLINISDTKVYNPPTGRFISICMDNPDSMRQPRLRESIIKVTQWGAPKIKFLYLCKSTKELNVYGCPFGGAIKSQVIDFTTHNTCTYITVRLKNARGFWYWGYKLRKHDTH